MRNTYAPALVLVAVLLPIPVLAAFITVIVYIVLGQQFGSPDDRGPAARTSATLFFMPRRVGPERTRTSSKARGVSWKPEALG